MKFLSVAQLVALDFDGTLTVKSLVAVRDDGHEYIIRSRKDSLLLKAVKEAGVQIAVISTEKNPVVSAVCAKLEIECFQDVETGENKLFVLQRETTALGLTRENVVFMGDDLNDLACLEWASVAVCPSDAHPVIKEFVGHRPAGASILLSAEGGNGALRQLTELLLLAKGKDIKR